MPPHQAATLALAAGAGAAAVLLFQRLRRRWRAPCTILCVTLKFATIDDREKFKKLFKPLAAYCAAREPGTLSYEFSEGAAEEGADAFADPTQCFIYERYPDARALRVVHDTSPLKEALGGELAKAGCKVEVKMELYRETGVGFPDRA